jgi:excisionase family DNA binding protein
MSKIPVVLTGPEILNAEEVAGILRLPLKTVRGLLHESEITGKGLKGTKIGKHWRVTKKDLERFLS